MTSIGIRTNRPAYRNDIAEEIRLFLGLVEIALLEDGETAELIFELQLTCEDGAYTLNASVGGFRDKHTFVMESSVPLEIKKQEKRQLKLATYRLLKKLCPKVSTPWGSLTGIRPTKLFRELSEQKGADWAKRVFVETYDVSREKCALAADICRVQTPVISTVQQRDMDVYVGIPFCRTRCLYCSFASEVTGKGQVLDRYLETLFEDISAGGGIARDGGYRIRSIYVGGGTPTVLSARQLEQLLHHITSTYRYHAGELTVEAGRPDTIDRDKLIVLRNTGVNRVSINPQTMHEATLERIGRAHTVAETEQAYDLAREIGFDSINMDLIAGLPGENLPMMEESMERIAAFKPDNLTIHALAIKRSSRLKARIEEYPLPAPEETDCMIQEGYRSALKMGMMPYYMYRQKYMNGNLENVGYCLPDKACVYNIDMMEETTSILSHGAGSITKRVFGGENRIERLPNPKDVPTYQAKLQALTEEKRRFFLD